MLVDVVDEVTASLELGGDIHLVRRIERLDEFDNVRVLAWCKNAGLLVVLGLLTVFEVLFVDDLEGNCHAAALVSSDFHCAYWGCSEVFGVIPVLVGLVDETLHFEELVEPVLLDLRGVEV